MIFQYKFLKWESEKTYSKLDMTDLFLNLFRVTHHNYYILYLQKTDSRIYVSLNSGGCSGALRRISRSQRHLRAVMVKRLVFHL